MTDANDIWKKFKAIKNPIHYKQDSEFNIKNIIKNIRSFKNQIELGIFTVERKGGYSDKKITQAKV